MKSKYLSKSEAVQPQAELGTGARSSKPPPTSPKHLPEHFLFKPVKSVIQAERRIWE